MRLASAPPPRPATDRRALPWCVALGLASLMGLSTGGCDPRRSPAAVADRFVDLYFVEIDQAGARPLTTGLATHKIDEELRLVEAVRREQRPRDAQPEVYYRRHELRVVGERARATYEVRILFGKDEGFRSVMLSLERVERRWQVGNFLISDGKLGPQPGGER